jgi:hypothetical protein
MDEKYGKKLSRSVKLRKYEKIYKSIMNTDKKSLEKSPRHTRNNRKESKKTSKARREEKKIQIKKSVQKRPLTEYNKFIRNESKKEIYKEISSINRMKAISEKWQKQK